MLYVVLLVVCVVCLLRAVLLIVVWCCLCCMCVLLSDFFVYLEEVVAEGVYNDGRDDVWGCSFGIYFA